MCIYYKQQLKMAFKLRKIHSSEQQQFCYPQALFLKNLFPFAIPLLRREMYPCCEEKTNVLEITSVCETVVPFCLSPLWSQAYPGSPAGQGTNRAL